MFKFFKNKKGQSLLESVFAIGILLIVLTALLGLTISNITGQKESENQVIANNLAREGIEVIRNVRDSNWLSGDLWDTGLTGDGAAVPVFDKDNNIWTLDFSYDVAGTVFLTLDGVYNQNSEGDSSSYLRLLTLEDICCEDVSDPANICDDSETVKTNCSITEKKIGIKVTSEVSWREKGRTRVVSLEDLLYAWK